MWERIKRYNHIVGNVWDSAARVWVVLGLVFGVTFSGIIAWLSTTWAWYWSTFNLAGTAIAFLVAYIVLAFGTILFSLAASIFAKSAKGSVSDLADDGPLTWFWNLTLEGGVGRPIYSLQFRGANNSQMEVELRNADIVSAINGSRVELEVVAVNELGTNDIVAIDKIQLIPPGSPITLVAKFNLPVGIEPKEFLETWRQFFLNVRDGSRTYRLAFNEAHLMPFFPGMVGPRVTKKSS